MTTGTTNRPTCDYDVLDSAFYQDPHPALRWMRENLPIYWDEKNQLWVLTRHADITYVSAHPQTFCSSKGVRPVQDFNFSIIGMDDPRHNQQRRLINRGFTPKIIRGLEGRVRQVVTETLDTVAKRGSCDFVHDIAVPIPLVVIAELMGLPIEDRDRFGHWSDRMMGGDGRTDPEDPKLVDAALAFGEYLGYISSIVEERRERYRSQIGTAGGIPSPIDNDLISVLVAASEEGILRAHEELTQDDLTMFLVIVVIAGNETTRNAIAGGMHAFGRFPGEWKRLVADPAHFATVSDEIVRYVSPIIAFTRTATCDVELAGQRILEGERVLLVYPSANRDDDVFDHPDEFRIDRNPSDHIGFGIGPHVCLGAHLARLEIRVVFEELVRRFPDIAVEPEFEPVYGDSTLVHAIQSLPVTFTPES